MLKNLIVAVIVSLLIVAALFCSIACADQDEALTRAASEGDVRQVQALLDEGVDVNARDKAGGTALMRASVTGHADIVRRLLDKGVNVNSTNKDGRTALMLASREVTGPHLRSPKRVAMRKS
jgi:uncharacterized protein